MRVNLVDLIPAYNEEAVIEQTIKSLFYAGMTPEKIIVINDASKDKTAEKAIQDAVNQIEKDAERLVADFKKAK